MSDDAQAVRRDRCFASAFKRWIGWTSWLTIATFAYSFVWVKWEPPFPLTFPEGVYDWLDDFFRPKGLEDAYDLAMWSTTIPTVLVFHALAWMALSFYRRVFGGCSDATVKWRSALFSVVGWFCWLVVSTFATLVIIDEIVKLRGGQLSTDGRRLMIEFVVGFLVVSAVHVVVLRWIRQRRA